MLASRTARFSAREPWRCHCAGVMAAELRRDRQYGDGAPPCLHSKGCAGTGLNRVKQCMHVRTCRRQAQPTLYVNTHPGVAKSPDALRDSCVRDPSLRWQPVQQDRTDPGAHEVHLLAQMARMNLQECAFKQNCCLQNSQAATSWPVRNVPAAPLALLFPCEGGQHCLQNT